MDILKIRVKDFLAAGEAQTFASQEFSADLKQVQANLKQALGQVVTAFLEEVADHPQNLVQVSLTIKGDSDFKLFLETGIINLAFRDIKRVDNFFSDEEAEVPLNVYLSFEAPGLNASGYRIDEITDLASAQAKPAKFLDLVVAQFESYLAMLAASEQENTTENEN